MRGGDQLDLLTTKQLADKWGVEPDYISYLRRTNQLPHIKLSEKKIRFDLEDVERWLETRKRKGGPT